MGRASGNGGAMATATLARVSATADPRRLVFPRRVAQVSNRVGLPHQKAGTATRQGWRSWQISYVPLTAISVGIWNGYVNGAALVGVETGCGGPLTAALSIEYPAGTFTRLTWAGAAQGTIADNAIAYTDMVPLPVTIPAFAKFRIAGDYEYLSGGTVPSSGWVNACDRAMGDEYQVNTTADFTLTSTVLGSGSVQGVFPQLVLGSSDRVVWGFVGDSIANGVNDAFFDPSGGRGLFGRALAESGPHLNYGVNGDRVQYAATNYARRLALMQAGGVTSAILQLGVNDLAGGRTSAQILADRASMRAMLAGIVVFDTTITPQTTSTDVYKTAAQQTVSATSTNTQRTTTNAALRGAVQPNSAGLIDVVSLLETSTAYEHGPVQDGGVWLPRYIAGSDGTHPNSLAAMAVKPLVQGAMTLRR